MCVACTHQDGQSTENGPIRYTNGDTIVTYPEYRMVSNFEPDLQGGKTYYTPEEAILAYRERWGARMRTGEKLNITKRTVSYWTNAGEVTLA